MATTKNRVFENTPLTYGVNLSDGDDRLDCAWFNPIVEDRVETLRKNVRGDRKLIRLRSIADVNGGKRLPKGTVITENESSIIPYIRAIDIKNLRVNLETAIRIPKEIHQAIQNYQIKQNDIVITIAGTIGEIGILEDPVEVCDFTENIARIRMSNDHVLPKFMLHFLDSEFGRIQTGRYLVGSLQSKLSLQSCRNIEVYLPFADGHYNDVEQQQIFDELYSILGQVEEKKSQSDKLIEEANSVVVKRIGLPTITEAKHDESFEQIISADPFSRLDALFNNPLRHDLLIAIKKYPHELFGKLVRSENGKITPSDFYRLVELEQVDEDTGRITQAREVPELGSEKILLKEGNLLISKLQPEKGKIVIVSNEFDGCVGSSELLPFALDSTKISLDYLWAVLRSEYVLKQWEYSLTGSSRMRIGNTELKETIVPIPDKIIQAGIVEEIKHKLSESDSILKEAANLKTQAKEEFVKLLVF